MGPLAIEFLYERIEASLLLQTVHAGWPGGFVLERQVHALVAAILLRVAGQDALDVDLLTRAACAPNGYWGECCCQGCSRYCIPVRTH